MKVVDCAQGRPVDGVAARLQARSEGMWEQPATGRTDASGCLRVWRPPPPAVRGVFRIVVDIDSYYASLGILPVFPQISTCFRVVNPDEPLHFMVLVTPYSHTIVHGTDQKG